MREHKIKWAALAFLFALTVGAGASVETAHAAVYTTLSTTKLAKTAYHKKSTAGAIYNKAHNRKLATMKGYPNTTWYVTQKATLKHGNSKGIYYYVSNKSGAVKGWIWHGYLTKGKAPFGLKYAKNAIAMDYTTGKAVWSKKANTARPIASVSKLMTLYLVLQKVGSGSGSWSDVVDTSSKGLIAMGQSYSCGGFLFKSGHKYTVQDLYYAALLDSSNNAAIALGKWVAGSNAKFIKQMNAQAKSWNLGKANFVSASGLENSDLKAFGYAYGSANANMVSAKDVALIARHLIQDYPRILTDGAIGSKSVDGQTTYNYNNLLAGRKYYQASLNVDGLKTGYTPLAGYCFVGTGQKTGKHRVITVVLHDINEFTETRSLMNKAYSYSSMNA
ncbi:MAG: serine hydrolase [Levilactobacillus sp.]|jgi:D-alanyl-D-alanine carboxypeptidase (penicillin-binding protein 5/6)|uniref:D-alanyl-D-alanine carboxypeptidase family protein n=1 Tax=Levilactobacillus sp. TaxID=2767919 RepID=UPI002590CD36|nr:serine hydrolase [Levilactobacillus sp.]MCH4123632.1 serine hydrolase [Levilactobacillus sp.]MCI1553730.1 serine hydrolase [Levilactobacillus sp.]MCI1599459.1 serine hydrolase [Levilactobacillus sp.]MCI1605891.1 serine hydrolase [Levilactobacillus sp.]